MKWLVTIIVLMTLLLPVCHALPQQCIANPKRTKVCPHLIYRSAQLQGMTKAAVICICVTDFSALAVQTTDEQERIKQNMQRRQLEATLGQPLQPILDIVNHTN